MIVAVVPLSLSVLFSRALLGLSRVRDSILVFSIFPTGVALAGAWVLAYQWGVNGAIVAYVIGVTTALIYGWMAWRWALAGRPSAGQPQQIASTTRALLRSGTPLLIGDLLQLMMLMSGTLLLGILADNADVGLFAVAWRTAALISFVLLAIKTSAQPKFAGLYARREMQSLAATAHKATLLMTVCAAPIFLVFLVAPDFVMSAFGGDFADGAVALQILSVGQFVNVASGTVGVLLVMSGHEREYRNVQIIAACVVLALNVVLIPSHGAVGAAIAAASALIVQNVLFGYFVWARLGILVLIPGQRSVRGA
jgi:O-antigen/teichoic acid export membrane protein